MQLNTENQKTIGAWKQMNCRSKSINEHKTKLDTQEEIDGPFYMRRNYNNYKNDNVLGGKL